MKINQVRCFFVLLFVCVLSGCVVGPHYQAPKFKELAHWNGVKYNLYKISNNQNALWWKSFNDAVLNQLMNTAIVNNLDFKIATNRILAAKANRLYSISQLFPQVRGYGEDSRQNQGWLTANHRLDIVQGNFDASWELDVFGGNKRKLEAQNDFLSASVEARNDIYVSLLAEVASSYIDFRTTQQQLAISHRNILLAFQSLSLSQSLQKAGIVSGLDTEQARALYYTFKSRLYQQNIALAQSKNRLTALLGLNPGELDGLLVSKSARIPRINEKVLLLMPSALIQQRPDIRRAERELAAQTALVGSAMSEWFPKISIGSIYGRQGTNFYPSLDIWSFIPRLQVPLLEFGRIKSQINLSEANQREAYYKYQQTILNAFEEVEDQLTAYMNLKQREMSLKQAAKANQVALTLSEERYKKGLSAFINVIQSEQDYYANENEAVIAEGEKVKHIVALYKALGIHSVI